MEQVLTVEQLMYVGEGAVIGDLPKQRLKEKWNNSNSVKRCVDSITDPNIVHAVTDISELLKYQREHLYTMLELGEQQ